MKYNNGNEYNGIWENDLKSGQGTITLNGQVNNCSEFKNYQNCIQDNDVGIWTLKMENNDIYTWLVKGNNGLFYNKTEIEIPITGQGTINGKGTLSDENGNYYYGCWKDNKLVIDTTNIDNTMIRYYNRIYYRNNMYKKKQYKIYDQLTREDFLNNYQKSNEYFKCNGKYPNFECSEKIFTVTSSKFPYVKMFYDKIVNLKTT
jgi:hypothetical protein